MSARCYTVDVDGEPVVARFTRPPTEDDIEALRELTRAVRRRADELMPPEMAERQAAARARNHERIERLRSER